MMRCMEMRISREIVIAMIATSLLSWSCVWSLDGNGGYDASIFQADYIQDITEYSSGVVNPALLYRVNQLRLETGFYQWGMLSEGSMGYQELSFIYPHRLNHTFGLTIMGTGTNITKTDVGASNTFGTRRYSDIWYLMQYSYRVLPWLVLGTNVKIREESQFGSGDGWGIGGDFGVYVNPIDHYRYGDIGLSVNFQDIVPTQVRWSDSASDYNQVGVSRFRVGLRYCGLNDRLVVGVEGVLDNAFVSLWESVMDDINKDSLESLARSGMIKKALRGSVHAKWEFIPQLWLKAGWTNNDIPYIGFNYNLIYLLPEMINYVNYDCHIGYSIAESDRGFTIMNKLSTDFGPTREQRESKRLYEMLILAPMDAYNEAMRLYLAGKYWEAGFAFGKVMSLYPNFYLNDKASFYMGNCYRFLQMNGIAREVYKNALEVYTTSDMRPKYLYGLENLDYREGKYEDALKNHAFITNLYGESEIRPDADYLAGEVHFLRKNYSAAEELLGRLKPGDPSYYYAQYTLSIINVENRKPEAAIVNLENVIDDTTEDASGKLLQDAANTKLGHLYFEQVELRKAVECYRRVSEGSSYGDEALLGTAWSWIKANQPEMCMQTVDKLIGSYGSSPLVPEAYLLRGYSQMLQKNYSGAIESLEKSEELAKGVFVTDSMLKLKQEAFGEYERGFEPTAEKIRKNALRKPTDKTIEARGGFKLEYDKYAKESLENFNYGLLAKSHKRFFMRKDEIVQDADYALAKATKILNSRKQTEEMEKGRKAEDNINKEIDKLKQQLKQENHH
jgi:tetratricopeptide (TPR) repeat protein